MPAVNVVLLPSSTGSGASVQFLSTFLIDGVLAVDAGCLGFWGDLAGQTRVRDVVLTHSHMDHVAGLPIFLENVYGEAPSPTIHGLPETLDAVRRDLFNDRIYPDLLGRQPEAGPFAVLNPIAPSQPRKLAEHSVTLVPVRHPVPTAAVVIEGKKSSVLIVTDTGPTDAIWAAAKSVPNLRAVFLETAFPNRLQWLADAAGHLTPSSFVAEVAKLPPGVPVYVVHVKARYQSEVLGELRASRLPKVQIAEPGKSYQF